MQDQLSTDEPSCSLISERISVIVPTLNEVHNVDALLTAILAPINANLDLEILIADGGTALVEQFGEPPILDRLRQEYLRPGDFRSSAKELEIRKT